MLSSLAWIPRGLASAEPKHQEFTEEELEEIAREAVKGAAASSAPGADSSDSEGSSSDEAGPKAVARARAVAAAASAAAAAAAARPESAADAALAKALQELNMDRYDEEPDLTGTDLVGRILGGAEAAFGDAKKKKKKKKKKMVKKAKKGEEEAEERMEEGGDGEEGDGGVRSSSDEEGDGGVRSSSDEEGEEEFGSVPSRAFPRPVVASDEDSDAFDASDSEAGSSVASERDALRVRPSDLVLLSTRNEDDVSHLEVFVYEQPDANGPGNLYMHHSALLPAFPLASAALDLDPRDPSRPGCMAAVSSFDPAIEIWDLDVIDAVEPVAKLGGVDLDATERRLARASRGDGDGDEDEDEEAMQDATEASAGGARKSKGKDKKKKKKKKGAGSSSRGASGSSKASSSSRRSPYVYLPGSHRDAVLALSWNAEFRNVLASGSADKTVKLWDLATQACTATLRHHRGKVSALEWNPGQAAAFASGGYDRRVCVVDAREAAAAAAADGPAPVAFEATVQADVEGLAWNPLAPHQLAAALESGTVNVYDVRGATAAPVVALQAPHGPRKAVTTLGFDRVVRDLLWTAGTDGSLAVWDLQDDAFQAGNASGSGTPKPAARADLKVGALLAAAACGDEPLLFAAGGGAGTVAIWDAGADENLVARVAKRDRAIATHIATRAAPHKA